MSGIMPREARRSRKKTPPPSTEFYTEWRVTGRREAPDPESKYTDWPPFEFVWSPYEGTDTDDPEGAARAVYENAKGVWFEGPVLSRRTVVRSGWVEVTDGGT